jgi:hypothetical protein
VSLLWLQVDMSGGLTRSLDVSVYQDYIVILLLLMRSLVLFAIIQY